MPFDTLSDDAARVFCRCCCTFFRRPLLSLPSVRVGSASEESNETRDRPSEGGRLFSGTPTTGRRRSKRLSKDETKWLFPHRIDPLLNDDNGEIVRRVRSGRSERSCHVWFENGCVSFRVFGVLSRSKRRARVLSLSLSLLPSSADATTSIAHV